MKKALFIFSLFIVLLSVSCKKPAGEGGNSSIKGNIWVEEWDASFTVHLSANDRVGMGEDVYIIYGDDVSYGDKIECSYDGTFEFKYLRKGTYTIYVYSKDPGPSGIKAIVKKVDITDKKQTVDAGQFIIKD
ncbi:MAG: hypothetical protein L6Q66_07195 [Bacteroidia bacterium]|nr:hypothetical protein [Bacteroidia bacterium]